MLALKFDPNQTSHVPYAERRTKYYILAFEPILLCSIDFSVSVSLRASSITNPPLAVYYITISDSVEVQILID